MSTVSCIVPTYNSARYLTEALDSIVAQSYRPIEIIVADDGSADATLNIARGYGHPLRVVTQTTAGPAATRNLGLKHADTEYVAFLDADDLWVPDKLAIQAAHLERHPSFKLCISYAQMFWSDPRDPEAIRYRDEPRAGAVPGYATTTLMVRRSVFDQVGMFDSRYWFSDAVEWFVRVRHAGFDIAVLPQVLTLHRMHECNLTRRRRDASRDEFLALACESIRRKRA